MANLSALIRCWQLSILLLLLGTSVFAQGPTWQAAVGFGRPTLTPYNNNFVRYSVVAANGDTYLAGDLDGSTTFGSISLSGSSATYVAKWSNSSNQFVWVYKIDRMALTALALSGNNIYVTGTITAASIQVGNFTIANTYQGPYATSEGVVAKLTDAGSTANWAWAQSTQDIGSENIKAIAVRGNMIYLTGYYTGTPTFGNSTLSNSATGQYGGMEAYVAKMEDMGTTGRFVWAQSINGPNEAEEGLNLVLNGSTIYATGRFASTTLQVGAITLTNSAQNNFYIYLIRLNDLGASCSVSWAQRIGSASGLNSIYGIGGTGNNIFLMGRFPSNATIGSTPLPAVATSPSGTILKLVDTGSAVGLEWAQRGAGTQMVVAGANLYFSSHYVAPTLTLGPHTVTNCSLILPNSSPYDNFVAKLVDDGSSSHYEWLQSSCGIYSEVIYSLSVRGSRVYVAGLLSNYTDAMGVSTSGTTQFGSHSLTSPSAFLAILEDGVVSSTAKTKAVKLTLTPNPAHGRATIQLPPGATALAFTDALGRIVRQQSVNGPVAELNLMGLAPGLYHVRVQAGGQQFHQRLVVE